MGPSDGGVAVGVAMGGASGGTHHFKGICLDAEVRVVLVALDHAGLHSSSPTLNEDLRPVHGQKLHLLHFTDSPEENLRRGPAEPSPADSGVGSHVNTLEVAGECPAPQSHNLLAGLNCAAVGALGQVQARWVDHPPTPPLPECRQGHCQVLEPYLHAVFAQHWPDVGRNWVDLGEVWWVDGRKPLQPRGGDLPHKIGAVERAGGGAREPDSATWSLPR